MEHRLLPCEDSKRICQKPFSLPWAVLAWRVHEGVEHCQWGGRSPESSARSCGSKQSSPAGQGSLTPAFMPCLHNELGLGDVSILSGQLYRFTACCTELIKCTLTAHSAMLEAIATFRSPASILSWTPCSNAKALVQAACSSCQREKI